MKILSFFIYALAIFISMSMGLVSVEVNTKDIIQTIIDLLFMELLIFICRRIKRKNHEKVSKTDVFIPNILIIFLTSVCNCRYGYGETFGILGYRENIGIFTIMEIPYEICSFILFLSYIFLWSFLCVKLHFKFKRKTLSYTFALLGTSVFIKCVYLLFSSHHLYDSFMLLSIFIYFLLYVGLDYVKKFLYIRWVFKLNFQMKIEISVYLIGWWIYVWKK